MRGRAYRRQRNWTGDRYAPSTDWRAYTALRLQWLYGASRSDPEDVEKWKRLGVRG